MRWRRSGHILGTTWLNSVKLVTEKSRKSVLLTSRHTVLLYLSEQLFLYWTI